MELGEGILNKLNAPQPSKTLRPGMVVALRHSTGKGCTASTLICDKAKAEPFLVVDAGGGYIGLLEGSKPYVGSVPLHARLMAIDATSSNGEISAPEFSQLFLDSKLKHTLSPDRGSCLSKPSLRRQVLYRLSRPPHGLLRDEYIFG